MRDETKQDLKKGIGMFLLGIVCVFMGGWAGPIGTVFWVTLTISGLLKYGCSWENLRFAFFLSFGLFMTFYWLKSEHEKQKKERRKRIMVARCKHCGNITKKKVVYLRE